MSYSIKKDQVEALAKSHPYDFEKFKSGQLAINSAGDVFKFIAHIPELEEYESVIVLRQNPPGKSEFSVNKKGLVNPGDTFEFVAMVPKTAKYYIGIFYYKEQLLSTRPCSTEQGPKSIADDISEGDYSYVKTIEFEIEEP